MQWQGGFYFLTATPGPGLWPPRRNLVLCSTFIFTDYSFLTPGKMHFYSPIKRVFAQRFNWKKCTN